MDPGSIAAGARGTLSLHVAEQLREAILSGRLATGEPIRQETIARELGTSRIPVREALRRLESEGLVTITPNRSARVSTLDFEECIEIYMMRERLEPLAFGASVGRLTRRELTTVAELADRIAGCADDPAAWLDEDRRFHLACYVGAPLPRLKQTIVGFWNSTQQYRRLLYRTMDRRDFEIFDLEHRLMVEALRDGSVRAGEELVRTHIERTRTRLTENRDRFDR